jgi:hypothetical protein
MYLEKAERQNFFSEKEFLEHGLQNGLEENLILGVDSKLALYPNIIVNIEQNYYRHDDKKKLKVKEN